MYNDDSDGHREPASYHRPSKHYIGETTPMRNSTKIFLIGLPAIGVGFLLYHVFTGGDLLSQYREVKFNDASRIEHRVEEGEKTNVVRRSIVDILRDMKNWK